jgi:hypothetical protein
MRKVTAQLKQDFATSLVNNVDWRKVDGDVIQRLVLDPVGTGERGTEWLMNSANMQMIGDYNVDLDAPAFVPDGWEAKSHIKGGRFKFDPKLVGLYCSDQQKAGRIHGDKLYELLKDKDCFNANLLDFYLAHPELIPESWKGESVFFWGTTYSCARGHLYIRYLHWNNGQWKPDHFRLGCVWTSHDLAAVRSAA